jgi:hypothetical protein
MHENCITSAFNPLYGFTHPERARVKGFFPQNPKAHDEV